MLWKEKDMEIKLITRELIAQLIKQASTVPRMRTNHNFHPESSDPIQRMIVALKKGTYIRPHRHLIEKKWEFAIPLTGRMHVLIFDDKACLMEKYELAPEDDLMGIEIPCECFHTWLPITEEASFFEFKAGPYSPQFTNQFPDWAPQENSSEAPAFLKKLAFLKVGESCI